MKKFLLALSIISVLCVSAKAQTNIVSTNTISTNSTLIQLGIDAKQFFTDASPFFTNGIRAGLDGIYSDKQFGGILHVMVPTSQQVSIGFAGAYIGKSFYDASLAINVGTTFTNILVIGPVYGFIESGPGYNFSTHSAIVQSFTGFEKQIPIGTWDLAIGGAIGDISDRPGIAYTLGFSFGKSF